MRRFPARGAESALGVGAYFVTFFLVGLWHGQTLMFVWLGILMGLGTSGNKLFQTAMIGRLGRTSYRTLCATPAYSIASRGLTYAWLAFTLVFFWATGDQMRHIVTGLGIAAIAASFAITLAAAALILAVWTAVENWVAARSAQASPVWTFAVRPAWYATLVTASVSVAAVLDAPAPHIIYRGF
jgi:D-alanyl-lipoteichoic acid acyltransferase DltB (MBOAT superfamily)